MPSFSRPIRRSGRALGCCYSAWHRSSAQRSPGSFSGRRSAFCRPSGLSSRSQASPGWFWYDRRGQTENVRRVTGRGIFFGILAALGQATGLVFSQQGMTGNFSPFAGTLIRMIAAAATLWIVACFQRQAGTTGQVCAGSRGCLVGSPSAHCSGRFSAFRRPCWRSSTPKLV